ncbi:MULTISPECIES: iron-containing alcohol dehydrogenase [Marinomonas]|uniref:Iron-containing alcohol dehydrogenase n=1 Tax=Marinomonas rhodophyticola TaxID=2992803 RepID=A0ABT3KBD9_9GAMM|nr:iron-containing alcohol dehydrogenase [Marinomonas sp. KJ51-3]MCW4627851.1 iron-containing alcohol dehydrogenase [Marinomonas sp. KJ51-3]
MNTPRNITIHQPSRLEVGANTVTQVGDWVGNKRALVITTSPVANHVSRLGLKGPFTTFEDTPPEPNELALRTILDLAESIKPEVIIGLGGGSVMDLAKLAAVLWNKNQTLEEVVGLNKVHQKLSTLIQIPTTAGTGSESGIRALVTNSQTSAKMAVESEHMRADIAILDPTLTYSVPSTVTAATGVDAMAHCVEAFTNIRAHNMIDDYARMGMKLIGQYLKRAVANGEDTEAREGMMLASYYGGICLGPVNTAAGHALAYPLSTQLHLPHGLANAIIFPHVLAFNADAKPEKTAEILAALGLPQSHDPSNVLQAAYAFCIDLGIEMKISKHGANTEVLLQYAEEAYNIKRLMNNNPKEMSIKDILAIYKAAF